MIYTSIGWKNFCATGNNGVEFDLTANKMLLIRGENGSGKSTLLDALSFLLYNKPFRKVSKTQLINTINNKDTLVWGTFQNRGKTYRVERGMKPNVFNVYEDGVAWEQEAEMKVRQANFESKILESSWKTFCQVDILGSAKYTPFMELEAKDRRTVVEDFLTLGVYSAMTDPAKTDLTDVKERIQLLEDRLWRYGQSLTQSQTQQNAVSEDREERRNQLNNRIEGQRNNIAKLESQRDELQKQLHSLESSVADPKQFREMLEKYNGLRGSTESQATAFVRTGKFFAEHDHCELCKQGITAEHKHVMISEAKEGYTKSKAELETINSRLQILRDKMEELQRQHQQINDLRMEVHSVNSSITMAQQTISQLQEEIEATLRVNEIVDQTKVIEELRQQISEAETELGDLRQQQADIILGASMLKDDGIKSSLISRYIPLFNERINHYLQKMNFFCYFELDSEFNETIKARYMDAYSYHSFSEGQKMRINLAILFAWRDITKIQNNVSSNILVMDEVMDSSLDARGQADFLSIIKDITDGSNVIVISHHPDAREGFEKVVEVSLVDNFSNYVFT